MLRLAIFFMAGRIPAFPGGKAHASAKPWDRHSPEWLGTNVQVGDFFHGRSDTGVPRGGGSRLSEALGPPFSRTARYKFRSAIPFLAGLESGASSPNAWAKH